MTCSFFTWIPSVTILPQEFFAPVGVHLPNTPGAAVPGVSGQSVRGGGGPPASRARGGGEASAGTPGKARKAGAVCVGGGSGPSHPPCPSLPPPSHCPWLWRQAKRINTLKARPGIIKMTNWGIEAIYAFVYLKILATVDRNKKNGACAA